MSAAEQLVAALGDARLALRLRRRRMLLSAVGIVLASAMLAAAVVITDGLGDGFNRAVHRADLGDLIVRFDPDSSQQVAKRIAALPDISGFALRTEVTEVTVAYGDHRLNDANGEVINRGSRQGYAVVAGHNLSGAAADILVEPAFAQAWGIKLGSSLFVDGLGPERVIGYAEGPDDVGYPLGAARFYLTRAQLTARFGADPDPQVNFAEIWLRNPAYLNAVLVQARDEAYGLKDLQFATRAGVQVLVHQAAGIVIDLLVALSLIALATAAVMLAASARAEVQRRLRAIGIRRAVGATRLHVTLTQSIEALAIAVPAATLGTLLGWLATGGPGNRLLALLNQPAPGATLILPLALGWIVSLAVPVLGAAWPAWTAAGRGVIMLMRGSDVTQGRGLGGRGGGLGMLGARLVAARPVRLAATVTMLACSTAFILLMIALASTLNSLATDPQELGKQYQLTASAPPSLAARIARLPGVAAAAPRYEVHAVDAYSLGELVDVIGYPGDHTRFEAPPLSSGSRLRGEHQAEVGVGLADALGLSPGSELLLQMPSGRQLQLTVSGTVSSLDDQGLVAYVPAAALLAAEPTAPSQIAVLLTPSANQSMVTAELQRIGANPDVTAGATARGGPLIAVLKTILRAVAIVDGLMCIYALVQACALTVQERRRTVAVLRACGASAAAVRRLLTGAVLALMLPAAAIGVALERFVLGPALAGLAAGYASLVLTPSLLELVATLAGLTLAGTAAVFWVARSAVRESVVAGLAE